MNKLFFCVMCIFGLCIFAASAQAKEWYEGGTLHGSTVQEWLTASPENVLATTGDIVAATTDSAQLRSLSSSTLKNASIDVAKCTITAVEGVKEVYHQKASQFAVLCLVELQAQYPWMLSKKQ